MSNVLKEEFYSHNESLSSIIQMQDNDPICNILKSNDISINLTSDTEIYDFNWKSLGFFEINEIFNYLIDNYPFIISVPEEYWNQILNEWKLLPVSPSDNPYICWFKWTLWRDPFLTKSNNEKRYLVKINKKLLKNLYPYLNTWVNQSFRWVCFFPLEKFKYLELWVDYEVLGLFKSNDIWRLKTGNQVSHTKQNILNLIK